MRTIRVRCPSDGMPYQVPGEMLGRRMRCRHCGTEFEVVRPSPSQPASAPPDPIPWGDKLLFAGTGLLVVLALIHAVVRWAFGIDLLRP